MLSKQHLLVVFLVLQIVLAILRMCRGRDVLPLVAMARRVGHDKTTTTSHRRTSARASSSSSGSDSTNSVMLVNPTSGDLSTVSTTELLQSTTELLQQLSNENTELKEKVATLESTVSDHWNVTVRTDKLIEIRNKYYEDMNWKMRLTPFYKEFGIDKSDDFIHIQNEDKEYDEPSKWYIKQFDNV